MGKTKQKPIRWTLEKGASEFGINPRTLTARVKQSGILPGTDGLFSTRDIAAAIHGDLEKEKLLSVQLSNEAAQREALKQRQIDLGELVYLQEFVSFMETLFSEVRRIIAQSKLMDLDKAAIFNELAKIHLYPSRKGEAVRGDGAPTVGALVAKGATNDLAMGGSLPVSGEGSQQ